MNHRLSSLVIASLSALLVVVSACGQGDTPGAHTDAMGNVNWEKLARISGPHGAGSHFDVLPDAVLLPALLEDVGKVTGLATLAPVPMVELDSAHWSDKFAQLAIAENEIVGMQALVLGTEAAFGALGIDKLIADDADDQTPAPTDTDDDLPLPDRGITLGYYDATDKTFFMKDDLKPEQRTNVMRHELMHALQDQHFGLHARMMDCLPDLDQMMAFKAAVEGQAEMAAFRAGRLRENSFSLLPAYKHAIAPQKARALQHGTLSVHWPFISTSHADVLGASAVQTRAERKPPNLVFFPYAAGTLFYADLMMMGTFEHMRFADWVQEIFAHMPRSTHQILHPYDYAIERHLPAPEPLAMTALTNVAQHPVRWQSGLGELIARAYLFQATHLNGDFMAAQLTRDRVVVLEQPASTVPAVAWVTEWRDEASAQTVMQASKAIQEQVATRRRARGITPGHAFIQRVGTRVGLLLEVARDNGHPAADEEHQHLLANAMDAALREL